MKKSKQEANAILDKLLESNVKRGLYFLCKYRIEMTNQKALESMGEFIDYAAAEAYKKAVQMCAENIHSMTGYTVKGIITVFGEVLIVRTGKEPDIAEVFTKMLLLTGTPCQCEHKRKCTRSSQNQSKCII